MSVSFSRKVTPEDRIAVRDKLVPIERTTSEYKEVRRQISEERGLTISQVETIWRYMKSLRD